jgi:hypothetical protein
MLLVRVGICLLVVLAAPAQAKEPPVHLNDYDRPIREIEIGYRQKLFAQLETPAPAVQAVEPAEAPPPRPSSRQRALRIAIGVVGGVVLIGAIVAIGVANASSSSSNQTGYNDWGTLVIMRR